MSLQTRTPAPFQSAWPSGFRSATSVGSSVASMTVGARRTGAAACHSRQGLPVGLARPPRQRSTSPRSLPRPAASLRRKPSPLSIAGCAAGCWRVAPPCTVTPARLSISDTGPGARDVPARACTRTRALARRPAGGARDSPAQLCPKISEQGLGYSASRSRCCVMH